MNVRRAALLGLAAGALVVAAVAAVVLRTGRAELASFRPSREVVRRPPSLSRVTVHDVTFATARGTRIGAWWIPSRNGAAVVLAHGSLASRMALAPEAIALEAAGFGALLFDWPGHGESEGVVTYGSGEVEALGAAVSFVLSQPDVDRTRIGALGVSVGAALVAVGAARDPRLRALALVSAFTDSDEQTRYVYRRFGALGALGPLWVDHRLMDRPLRPIDAVPALAERPVLYVAGAEDPVVPVRMARQLLEATGPRAELWVIPGGGHGDFDTTTRGAYSARLVAFFEGTLAGS